MLESILYMFHGFIILLFGALLSIVFAGIRGGGKNCLFYFPPVSSALPLSSYVRKHFPNNTSGCSTR